MKLASFIYKNQKMWGLVSDNKKSVIPLDELSSGSVCLLDYIAHPTQIDNQVSNKKIDLMDVELCSPIPKPVRNIFCIGKNYKEHIKELAKDEKINGKNSEFPNFFTKATNTVSGPYDDILVDWEATNQVDYEAELAVIIGKQGKNIKAEDVYDYIFGYTILNDMTARDVQRNHVQWFKGKSMDGFCPIGPWIITKDELCNPQNLNIKSYVNGEERQSSNTCNMIYDIKSLISILSQGLTLYPGDIIATGTPSGVGMGFNPPKLLKSEDVVKIEIDGIGSIENKVL